MAPSNHPLVGHVPYIGLFGGLGAIGVAHYNEIVSACIGTVTLFYVSARLVFYLRDSMRRTQAARNQAGDS